MPSDCFNNLKISVTANRQGDLESDLFVDRSVNMGGWVQVATDSFVDKDLVVGNGYRYKTRLVRNGITTESTPSTAITITAPCAGADTPGFSLSNQNATTVRVTVQEIPDGELYLIYRKPNYGIGDWIAKREPGSLTYDDTGRSSDTEYCYRVLGITEQGCRSALAAEQCITTWPLTPKDFDGLLDDGECPSIYIDLSWGNGGRSEQKTLQVYNHSTSSWENVSTTIGTGDTTYRHQPTGNHIDEGQISYRIKFNSESDWTTTQVFAICPE